MMEDVVLALGMHRYGHGCCYELLRNDLRNHPALQFNLFAKARTV